MPGINQNSEDGLELLSRKHACKLAEDFRIRGGHDPCRQIPRALLSAEHIIEYATATGMISPLYDGKRMKKASYQGRIGENAYEYNESGQLVCVPVDDKLIVKANSIVFVECDIDFRLPNFIAVRFNLHIRHVHRGLLLGTGPLVDPGDWGKLCIPLHNLTDKDYPIPRNKGLIWVEFTKTSWIEFTKPSSKSSKGRDPSGQGYWDIKKFIERAADQYEKKRVPIRSSIPVAVQNIRERAKSAEKTAEDSKKEVENTKEEVRRFTTVGYIAGVIGIVTIFFGVVAIIIEVGKLVHDSIDPQIEEIELKMNDMEKEIQELRNQITDTQNRNVTP